MQFSTKNRRCYLFKEALKLLFSFLEVVRFYNINHFLCSKIFSWAFGFGSTHGGCMRDYHLKDVNLKTWIIHEQLGLGIGWIHFWDPITPRILKITLILQGTYFCYYWPFQALCMYFDPPKVCKKCLIRLNLSASLWILTPQKL